jgi:integrase
MTKKPFFRAFDGWWYAQLRIGGKRVQRKLVKGKENEEQAWRELHRLLAQDPAHQPDQARLKVANICDLFLLHSEKQNESKTFRWYQKFLQSFCEACGTIGALDVKPFNVTGWLDAHPGWKTSRRCAVICIKRAYNWAEEEGIIDANPLKKVRKPPSVKRERILTPAERQEILHAIKDRQFREFVYAMQETGCRPGEIRKVTAAMVNLELEVWVFEEHKTRKRTGKPRIVYLTPGMTELSKRLVSEYPAGPLFRGPRGKKPYSRNAVRCRFRRLREKLPHLKGVVSYSYRHSFITDALVNGVPVATVAELAGHTDLKMIQEHYGHLSQKVQHLRDAAKKAAGYGSTPPEKKESA